MDEREEVEILFVGGEGQERYRTKDFFFLFSLLTKFS